MSPKLHCSLFLGKTPIKPWIIGRLVFLSIQQNYSIAISFDRVKLGYQEEKPRCRLKGAVSRLLRMLGFYALWCKDLHCEGHSLFNIPNFKIKPR